MTNVLIKHKVNNYEQWKAAFDAFVEARKKGGEKSYRIFRPLGDENNLVLLFEWESVETAKTFMDSAQLTEAMQQAGVVEPVEITMMAAAAEGALA